MTQEEIQRIPTLLERGALRQALILAEQAVADAPEDANALYCRGLSYRAHRRFDDALSDFDGVLRRASLAEDTALAAQAHMQRGVVYTEKNDWPSALAAFEAAADDNSPSAELCAALCQTLCRLDRRDEALAWRQRAIEIRDREAFCDKSEIVSSKRPRIFDSQARSRNIVSYSLFGSDPYYQQCSITIARTTPTSYPEFTPRFYCSRDVPTEVLRALRAAGAQVAVVDNAGSKNESPFAGTLWRFLAFDDPDVDVVLVRDVDSPILPRERAAIDLWLSSDKPFYCMRDNAIHAEPMLAGLWGGFTGLLPKLEPLLTELARHDHSRFADQRFLRRTIWPRIREATLAIDDDNALGHSVRFPEHPKHASVHVGMNWTRAQILGQIPRREAGSPQAPA